MVMPPACKCFTDEQRKFCKQKRECVKIEAHSNVQSKWRAACGTSKRPQGAV
jgi:hypothetical protein